MTSGLMYSPPIPKGICYLVKSDPVLFLMIIRFGLFYELTGAIFDGLDQALLQLVAYGAQDVYLN